MKDKEIKLKEQDVKLAEIMKDKEIKLKEQDIELAKIELEKFKLQSQFINKNQSIDENISEQSTELIDDGLKLMHAFLDKNMVYKQDCGVNRADLWQRILDSKDIRNINQTNFYNKIVPEWLKIRFNHKNLVYESKAYKINKKTIRGWKNFQLL
jgi:hypothetical protein